MPSTALHRARAGLDAFAVALAGAAEDRGLALEDGATSTTAWLANTTGTSKGDAAKLVSLSRVMSEQTEATRLAWAAGDITTEQAGIILRSVAALPDWAGNEERADGERILLDQATVLAADDLRRLGNHLIQVIDPDGADELIGKQLGAEEQKAWDAVRLKITDRHDGGSKIFGVIPTAQAHMFRTALEALASPRRAHVVEIKETYGPPRRFRSGPPQPPATPRRCELIEHLPTKALPHAGGLPATVTIDIDLSAPQGRHGCCQAVLRRRDVRQASGPDRLQRIPRRGRPGRQLQDPRHEPGPTTLRPLPAHRSGQT